MHLLTRTASPITFPDEDSTGDDAMTSQEMKRIRKKLGLSVFQLGRACGHTGKQETVNTTIRRYEAGMKDVPATMARLLIMFDRYGVPEEFLAASDEGETLQTPGDK